MNETHRGIVRLTAEEARLVEQMRQWRSDMPGHAARCLKVIAKDARLVPMVFNEPQLLIHAKAEQQMREQGMVRAMILKSRKQGSSTYVGARFYNKTRLYKHRNAKVMAHEQDSTNELFAMVQNFYNNDPFRLEADRSNAKQMAFSNGSSYTVGTAGGSGESGRGGTPTLAHMSEVAFYKNAEKNFASFANSVPTAPGTEIFVESTANGIGNEFHKRWVMAEAGLDDAEMGGLRYIPIFIPWFLSSEYRLPVSGRFELRSDPEGEGLPSEREIAEMFALDNEQMAWRRFTMEQQLGGNVEKFMQENPSTAAEAFQTSGSNPFIAPIWVLKARKRTAIRPEGPKVLGVDPAGPSTGADKFSMTLRQGMVMLWHRGRKGVDPQEAIHWVAGVIRDVKPDRVNIDNGGGWGASLLSGLRAHYPELAKICFPVDFGGRSQTKAVAPHRPGPRNRRAEMYLRMREWFMAPEGCSIPDEDDLAGDLAGVSEVMSGQSTDTLLKPKTETKKEIGRSPDTSDSAALTFAHPDRSIQTTLTDTRPRGNEAFAAGAAQPVPQAPRQTEIYDPYSQVGGGFDSGGDWMG